jgi:hypothetical protein
MYLLLIVFNTFAFPMEANSKDFWWPYLASYEAGPGSIRVNLGLRKQVPLSGYRHLVVTGTTYNTERPDGLPDTPDLERLNTLSEKIVAAIQTTAPSVYVGTFTHNREQLHYVYVSDPSQIESILSKLYLASCPGCKTYTNIKLDPSWSAYTEFLYPNRTALEFYREELHRLGFVPQ